MRDCGPQELTFNFGDGIEFTFRWCAGKCDCPKVCRDKKNGDPFAVPDCGCI